MPNVSADKPHASGPPSFVDHVLIGAPDLESGCDHVERLLGVRPVSGGRHPVWGTHNALLSLGPATYLEVIAPDPDLDAPERGRLFDLDSLSEPRLVTWVLRSEDIDPRCALAEQAGIGLGRISAGHRELADGARLTWRLSDPYAMPLGGAVPFLISWGDSPHPGATSRRVGSLEQLRIEHAEPDRVRAALDVLGVRVPVERAPAFALIASVRTSRGLVEIR